MQIVYVRGLQDDMKRFALLSVEGERVYVCPEDWHANIMAGGRPWPSIAFRKLDVFECHSDKDYLTAREAREMGPVPAFRSAS